MDRSALPPLALALVLLALSALRTGSEYLNHDPAWYVYMAGEWLRGATLYRDIVDTNPPLIVWITAVPVAVAMLTGTAATAAFKTFVFAIAAASLLVAGRIVLAVWPRIAFPVLGAAVFLALPFVKEEFGQREHLAVLLTLPYVVAAAAPPGAPGARWRWAAGIAGGIGFAIKPYFIPAWLAIELVAIGREGTRALRRELFVASLSVFVIYAAVAALLVPQYFGFARQIVEVYAAMNASFGALVRLREVQLWLIAAAVFAAIRWPRGDALLPALFAAATGYLAGGLLQLKGWPYQMYPARVFVLLFLVTAVATLLEHVPALFERLRGGRRGAAIVFAATLVAASGRYLAEARHPSSADLVGPMIETIRTHADGGPVVLFSMRTQIYPAFPAVNYAPASWGMRYNTLFFMPGLYQRENATAGGVIEPHAPGVMSPLEAMFFRQVVEDLCAHPPSLLAVDIPPQFALAGRRAVDFRQYYSQAPAMKGLLAGYQPVGEVGPYQLLVPTGDPACARED